MQFQTACYGNDSVVPVQNRLLLCPECGGRLSSDKNAFTAREGHILRERVCSHCHSIFYTRQDPERVTRVVGGQ